MQKKKQISNPDFSGYATKNGLKCSDGRTIVKDAFKHCDGVTVPLVWQHLHNDPSNVLGHAVLENRDDGVYTYGIFNDTPAGKNAKVLVQHGDINALSIYANGLKEQAHNVIHGVIREVSLVMSGANPGALIDNVALSHSDGTTTEIEDEAIIYTDSVISLQHEEAESGETVEDVFNSLSEKQKTAVYAIIGSIQNGSVENVKHAANEDMTVKDVFETLSELQKTAVYAIIAEMTDESDKEVTHSNGGNTSMKKNVFDQTEGDSSKENPSLSHSQFSAIMSDAQACGSFREAFLAHAVEYGIENIDYLFPDARTLTNTPAMIQRKMEWVSTVINGTHHTPFSRIKSVAADITAEEARAKGYVKASLKKEEVVKLLKRTTTSTTVYKKQKLDRDDIIDITDMDVVAWLKAEMRVMLDEELGRAVLIGDGREASDDDKINEDNIRPIYKDDDMYSHKVRIPAETTDPDDIIDLIIRARKEYKGSGNPIFFTTTDFLTDMLLTKDTLGNRIYKTLAELESTLRVSKIIDVEVMDNVSRESDDDVPVTLNLLGIMVNLKDYTIGADKGGSVSMFDDFDIDYNQYKYLLETRCSGALTLPKAALVIEQVDAD